MLDLARDAIAHILSFYRNVERYGRSVSGGDLFVQKRVPGDILAQEGLVLLSSWYFTEDRVDVEEGAYTGDFPSFEIVR